ncbi:MAG: hypothetical protein JO057_00740 [Chloroflexi bacterium]|nr:hypothetical protein [Chloroflexota bacterium]
MSPNVLLPTLTCLIGLAFATIMARRYVSRRQPYYLVWALGLLWYALADGSEALGGALGWNTGLYRLWYLTGAIGVAAFLGAGSLYLHRDPPFGSLTVVCVVGASVPALATDHLLIGFLGLGCAMLLAAVLTFKPERFAEAATAILVAGSLVAAYVILTAPVDQSLLPASPDQIVSGQAFDADTRALTPPFNIAGALVLILGAALSALQAIRTRELSNRISANILIAVGAFIPSVASGLTRFGVTSLFFVGELVGLTCIMVGFLLSARKASS